MFGASDLKRVIKVTDTSVECPVIACKTIVPRQRTTFQRSQEFFCPKHSIYISPSTFEYGNYEDNLLWKDKTDLDLLQRIMPVKRESRIARDNSEDALTWNVFRFYEKENLLQNYLSRLSNAEEKNPEIMYWSYSQSEQTTWSKLFQARQEFERNPTKGSEPDLIIKTDKTLFIIEAKLNASNNTVPTSKDPLVKEKYLSGGSRWYQNVFTSDFETVAINCRKYELLRFWLLGSWIAHHQDLKFLLIILVPSDREKDIETRFKKHIKEDLNRTFLRATWEDNFSFIHETTEASDLKKTALNYLKNKTSGYHQLGELQRTFSI
jgi:hypothetical protein